MVINTLDIYEIVIAIGMAIFLLLFIQQLKSTLPSQIPTANLPRSNIFQNLILQMEIGVLLLGQRGEILFTNQAALEIIKGSLNFTALEKNNQLLDIESVVGQIAFPSEWEIIDEEGKFLAQEFRPIEQAIASGEPVRNAIIGIKFSQTQTTQTNRTPQRMHNFYFPPAYHNNRQNADKWLMVNVYPQNSATGKVEQLVCTLNDITETKHAEAAIKAANEQLQAVLEAVPGYVSWMSSDLRYMGVNHNLAASFGLSPEDFYGKEIGFLSQVNTNFVNLVQQFFASPAISASQEVDIETKPGTSSPLLNRRRCLIVAQKYLQRQAAVFIGLDISQRVQMEAAMRESEERFRAIVEATPMPVIITRIADNAILYANLQAGATLGISAAEILKRKTLEFYDNPDDQAAMLEIFLKEGFLSNYEVKIKQPAGEIRWVQVSMRSLTFNSQPAILIVFYDVTPTKQALESLRKSESKFQKLATNVPGIIYQFCLSKDGVESFPFVSSSCRQLYELEPEEIQQNPAQVLEMPHPEDRESFQTSIAISAETLQPCKWEGRIIVPSGKMKWIQAASRPEKLANGDILWDGLVMDITERKLAEEALRKSEARLAEAQKVAHVGSWEFDVIANTITWSDEAFRIFGLNPSYPLPHAHDISQLIHPDDQALWFTFTEQALQGNFCEFDYRILRQDGAIGYASIKGQPIFNEHDQIIKIFGTILDITQRKKAAEALQKANEELEIRVEERTTELKAAIGQLQGEIAVRKQTEEELRQSQFRYQNLAQQKELLNRLASQIRNSLDVDTILETAVQKIRSLLQIDRCHFLWCRASLTESKITVSHESQHSDRSSLLGDWPRSEATSEFLSPQPAQISALIAKIQHLELIRIDDIQTAAPVDRHIQELLSNFGVRAGLLLPLITHSGHLGAVFCSHSREIRPWSDREVELLAGVVDQLAIAIDQAELYAQTRATAAAAQAQAQQLSSALYELQQTQAQLVQSEKMSSLGQMVAGVAHEINNPVTFITGNLAHATTYFEDLLNLLRLYQTYYPVPVAELQAEAEAIDLEFLTEDIPKVLESMQMGAERIRQIVLSLRNFSRLDEADMKPVDVHEGIDNTLLILQHRLNPMEDGAEIEIIKEYGNLSPLACYPGQLNQVFMHILSNAIDALENHPDPRVITITTQVIAPKPMEENFRHDQMNGGTQPSTSVQTVTAPLTSGSVLIKIRDNGPGMTAAVKSRLFDPFFTTKPVGKGTGLGLSISYKIVVDQHGGTLQCFSSPGEGAEFWIELPIRQNW